MTPTWWVGGGVCSTSLGGSTSWRWAAPHGYPTQNQPVWPSQHDAKRGIYLPFLARVAVGVGRSSPGFSLQRLVVLVPGSWDCDSCASGRSRMCPLQPKQKRVNGVLKGLHVAMLITAHVASSIIIPSRRHLSNVRVVQKNLVYVIGLPHRVVNNEALLRRNDFFGKYGKIHKVVINKNNHYNSGANPTVSAYITFARKEDASHCVRATDKSTVDGRVLRASLGTTKYCSNFLRNQSCPNPDCMYNDFDINLTHLSSLACPQTPLPQCRPA